MEHYPPRLIPSKVDVPKDEPAPRALVASADSLKIPRNMGHFSPLHLECSPRELGRFDMGQSEETGTSALKRI